MEARERERASGAIERERIRESARAETEREKESNHAPVTFACRTDRMHHTHNA